MVVDADADGMALEKNIRKVKKNVWKVEEGEAAYSLKRYDTRSTAVKVEYVHQQLHAIRFPNIVPIIPTEDPLFIMQPWIEGTKPVNFRRRIDRTDSLLALQALHRTKEQIDWNASPYLHRYQLLDKWRERLSRFIEKRMALEKFLTKQAIDEIVMYGEEALPILKKNYKKVTDSTLLHGDVVHHNILRDGNGLIRFIDFDLACLGPSGTELALWMHRVLPNVNYNLEFLLSEQSSLRNLDNASKAMLLYPNELLREWLHLLNMPEEKQESLSRKLIPFTEYALSSWPKLWYDIERIMK
ncbi:aminoglycoside phosphotransferase family protein [Sporosarcina sp. ACRSL]|uniref:aminoglycoside phosphotransferase family protein n=1 Tax=Sporosarcina sp. ACRSL TaxID=2918215 RepID=UPI001EF60C1F|nr:aminoglycoside phosphotransferase family protein [Sporosarcina sp. ACRSL]MCG7345027.1 aminoglycoside phosphotransferase family protein [Sporosarcina sp. ACRSL]